MTLPTSRDVTLNPADPFPSTLGNKLQDCIIGMKHPEIETEIPTADWIARAGTLTYNDGEIVAAGGYTLIAPIRLPVGDRLTTLSFLYVLGASGSVTYSLKRRDMTVGGAPPAAATLFTATDNTNTGLLESSALVCNHTIASGWTYWAEIVAVSNTTKFYGGILKADRL